MSILKTAAPRRMAPSARQAVRALPWIPKAVRRAKSPPRPGGQRLKALTIGAVCQALVQEFPDISISKIRYLEDQKRLTPAAHAGRVSPLHPERRSQRLRTILRMQRDEEFLPLRGDPARSWRPGARGEGSGQRFLAIAGSPAGGARGWRQGLARRGRA